MIPSSHQLSLRLIEKCPSCHSLIPHRNINILDETENNLFAHLDCAHCHTKYLTYIVNHPQGLIGNAILTDLTYEETLNFIDLKPIDENNFLVIHKAITTTDFIKELKNSIQLK